MADQNKQVRPPLSADEINQRLMNALDRDPELAAEMQQEPEDDPALAQEEQPETQSGLWSRLKQSLSNFRVFKTPEERERDGSGFEALAESNKVEQEANEQLVGAMARGTMKAGGSALDLAVGAGVGISKETGLYQLGRTDEEEEEFLKWYEKPVKDWDAKAFGLKITGLNQDIDRFMGPSKGGMLGFVEGATQFAVGMSSTAKMLKGAGALPVVGQGLKRVGEAKVVGGLLKGAITDFTFFDPYADRISNVINEMSSEDALYRPLTDFLATQEDDSALEGRLKNALEGSMIGASLDTFIIGLRFVKGRGLSAMGKKAAGDKMMSEALEKLANAEDLGPVGRIVETPEGKFAIELNGPQGDILTSGVPKAKPGVDPKTLAVGEEAASDARAAEKTLPGSAPKPGATPSKGPAQPAPGPEVKSQRTRTFASRAEAENELVTLEVAAANRRFTPGKLDDKSAEAWRQLWKDTRDMKDPRKAAELLEQYGFNMKYIQEPQDVLNVIKQMADLIPEPSKMSRNKPKSWKIMAREAEDMFPGMRGDEVLDRAAKLFGDTEKLDSRMTAMRAVMWRQARYIKKLALIADSAPNNALAVDQLAKALDTLLDLHANVTGSASNIARALNAQKAPLGELIERLGRIMPDGGPAGRQAAMQAGEDALQTSQEAAGKAEAQAAGPAVSPTAPVAPGTAQAPSGPIPLDPGGFKDLAPGMKPASAAEAAGMQAAREKGLLQAPPAKKVELPHERTARIQVELAEMDKSGLKGSPEYAAKSEDLRRALDQTEALGANKPGGANQQPQHRAPGTQRATAGLTRPQIRAMARMMNMADGDPAATLKAMRSVEMFRAAEKVTDPTLKKKLYDGAMAFRMEAMLSGPKTQITNLLNNAAVMFMRPMEFWWAGQKELLPLLRKMETGEWRFGQGNADLGNKLRTEGWDMMTGLMKNWAESWKGAKRAFAMGQNLLDPGTHAVADVHNSLGAWSPNVGKFGPNLKDMGSHWLSRMARLPSRMLMTSDEFFKHMNYRVSMRAQILRQARQEGLKSASELAERLSADMEFAFSPEGAAINPRALDYARVNTFTNSLDSGWGQTLHEAAIKHPSLRIIAPFIRTPVNVFRYAWERTPMLNRLNAMVREDLKAGGERAALAKAKADFGWFVWGSAAILAHNQMITGRGPSDPKLRKQWVDAGFQPYSFRVGDRWFSYRKGDPVLTGLGMVADIYTMSGEMDQKDQEYYASAVVGSLIANVSSKTFMQGIVDFMDMMNEGRQDKIGSFTTSTLTSFIPNLLRQMNPDDTMRETRGLIDEVMDRIPGLSKRLEPRRNLFGEPIMRPPGHVLQVVNPFTMSGAIKDPDVAAELVALGKGFAMPAEKREGGVLDLTDRDAYPERNGQSPYDRMLQLMAEPADGGKSLRTAMEELVNSKMYQSLHSEDMYGPGGARWSLAAKVIAKYQNKAWMQVLKEYPSLKQAWRATQEMKARGTMQGKQGVSNTMQKIEEMFGAGKSPVKPKIKTDKNPIGDFPVE